MRSTEKIVLRIINVITIVLIIVGAFAAIRYFTMPKMASISVPVIRGEGAAGLTSRLGNDPIRIAEARTEGRLVGCGDSIEYVPVRTNAEGSSMTAAYQALFTGDELVSGSVYSNPLSAHLTEFGFGDEGPNTGAPQVPLKFDRVEVVNGVAAVYLTGEYKPTGSCEPPQIEAVLTFAAKKHDDTVQTVRIYINDVETKFPRT